jgi:hypothetical protein
MGGLTGLGQEVYLPSNSLLLVSRPTLDMAGWPAAYGDDVLAPRLQAELGVECRYTVEPTGRDAQFVGKIQDRVLRDVPEDLLCFLEQGDDIASRFAVVLNEVCEDIFHK